MPQNQKPLDDWQLVPLDDWQEVPSSTSKPKEDESSWYDSIFTVPNAIRFAGSAAGSVAGGAAAMSGFGLPITAPLIMGGGAAGEALARWYEGKDFDPGITALEGALNLLPGGGTIPGAKAGIKEIAKYGTKQAMHGAWQGGLGAFPRHQAEAGNLFTPSEWEMPSLGEVAGQTVGGAVIGGATGTALGGAHVKYQNRLPKEATPAVHVGDMSGYNQGELPLDYRPQQETLIPHPINRFDELSNMGVRNPEQTTELDALRQQLGADKRPPVQPPGIDPFTQRFRKIRTGDPTQQGFDLTAPVDEGGQGQLFDMQPSGVPPMGEPVLPTQATPPPPVAAQPANQQVVTLTTPDAATVEFYRNQGYVSVPGLRSPEGHVQMVRGDVAPLYVTGDKTLPTPKEPNAFEKAMRAKKNEAPGPMSENQVGAGDEVPVPNANITETFISNMKEAGYQLAEKGPTTSIFRRLLSESEGEFTPVEMWNYLKSMFKRDPSEDEVASAMARQVKPGEPTGRVADFGFIPEENQNPAGLPPVDPAKLQQFRESLPDREPLTEGAYRGPNGEIVAPYPLSNDFQQLRQQNVLGPRAVGPNDMAAPIELGQQELPWARGENPQPVDADARMRQQAMEAEEVRRRGLPQPLQGELFPEQGRNEPSFDRSAPPSLQGGVFKAALAHMEQETDIDVLRQYMDMTTKALQYHRNSGDAAELSLYRQMREAVVHRLNTLSQFDEPAFARVEGGGYKASMNVRRGVENITKDYTSPLPGIMSREGMQNALDAAAAMGLDGDVKIRTDYRDKTIEIYDNGNGMDDATLGNKLFEAFSTGKEDEAGATGGKGIGSASYIYGGDHFEIETVAVDKVDGQKYRIATGGTPEQFIMGEAEGFIREVVPDYTPTGTRIKIKLKEGHSLTDAQTMIDKIVHNSRNREGRVVTDQYGITRGTPIEEMEPNGGDVIEHTFPKSTDDKMIGDFTTVNRNSEVKVLVPQGDPPEARSYFEVHYLNNGMYQFTDIVHLGQKADGVPERVLVDVHPLVDDQDELYPFINTREDIKKDIREEVTKFITKNISAPGIEKRKNRVQELYDSMSPVNIGTTSRKSIIFDPGNRLTRIEMDKLTNNPTIKALIQTYDKAINEILGKVGRQKWTDRLEGVGIVLDPNSHGLHVPNPQTKKSTILINPFIRIGDSSMTPREVAWRNAITNLHEVGHVGVEHGTPIKLMGKDLKDPRVGEFLSDYMNQLIIHGDTGFTSTGHGMDFAHRLGEVYAKYGIDSTFNTADEIHDILTGGKKSGGYSPEVQRLLQLYQESRGRDATTEDLLSGTGVKQGNRGFNTEGNLPSDSAADGDGVAAKVKELFSRFMGEEQGATPIEDIKGAFGKVKQATGWGQGASKEGKQNPNEFNFIKEALALPSAATTTGDLSAPGRQGLSMILTPQFWKAGAAMFKGLSPEGFKQIDADLRSKPIFQKRIDLETGKVGKSYADEIGMKLFNPASKVGPRAEATASRWMETGGNIPYVSAAYRNTAGVPIRASNRAYITFLNHLNANRTEFLLNKARDMSAEALSTGSARPGFFKQQFTPAEAMDLNPYKNLTLGKEIADFVNTATGHGPLKTHILPFKQAEVSLESAAGALGHVLFSPGLLASRVRMLNPSTYIMASPFVRKQYVKAALSTFVAWEAFTQLAKMGGAEVGDEPTSADYGKVRIGDTRIDPGGGFLQFLVLYNRFYQGGYTSSATEEFHRFGEGFQAETQLSNALRFGSNKLNPVMKFAWDVANASEYNPFHVKDRSAQMFVPLFAQDVIGIVKENPEMAPWLVPMLFGVGAQTYSKGESVGKIVDPENDWLATGGGIADLGPDYLHPKLDY